MLQTKQMELWKFCDTGALGTYPGLNLALSNTALANEMDAIGQYISKVPNLGDIVVDADTTINKAHINIVEASDNATVVQGEQLVSYDKAVVFDLEDTIGAVLSSTSLSSNNYADVRDIVITNSTLAADAS